MNKTISQSNVPSADFFFAPGGPIAKSIKSFEPRSQQARMALAVEQSLSEQKHLIIEAGTGVGKSLAYLLPCALWALRNRKKTVIATYTKALQEQLVKKDLPVVRSALEKTGHSLRYALLMGSENYLCLSRLRRCLRKGPELFDTGYPETVLDNIVKWSKKNGTGCKTEPHFPIPAHVWEKVSRDPDLCTGKRCPIRGSCLYMKNVERAAQSHLVVANQHLFFAGIPIPAFEAVVFDEAHNMEDVASQFFGFSLTNLKVRRLLDDIFNPDTMRGLARRIVNKDKVWLDCVEKAIPAARRAAKTLFENVQDNLGLDIAGKMRHSGVRRVRRPDAVPDTLSGPLSELGSLLSEALAWSETAEEEAEIKAHMNRCVNVIEQLNAFLKCDSKEHAYWAEIGRSKRNLAVSLNMRPLDVSKMLEKQLFERQRSSPAKAGRRPVILTSATLAVDGSFSMLKSRLGINGAREVLLDSPFDYQSQVVIHESPGIPDPKLESQAYEDAVIEQCPRIFEAVAGGIFVLFTSWHLLEKCSGALTASALNRPVFVQGDRPPQKLIKAFQKAGNGVLLATDTFWQGIDIPGAALSCVVITRLPFRSPNSPLEEARCEWMASLGMNVFNEYTLPKAVIKFRQGFGRLIRKKTDSGAVVILDPRIRTRPYGGMFLRSVPKCRLARSLDELKEFFFGRRPLEKNF